MLTLQVVHKFVGWVIPNVDFFQDHNILKCQICWKWYKI